MRPAVTFSIIQLSNSRGNSKVLQVPFLYVVTKEVLSSLCVLAPGKGRCYNVLYIPVFDS